MLQDLNRVLGYRMSSCDDPGTIRDLIATH